MPAPAAIGNTGSMLDRAIAAFIISLGIPNMSWVNVLPSATSVQKGYPCIIVWSHSSTTEQWASGNEDFQVELHFKFSATQAQGTPTDVNRVSMDLLVGQVMNAMLASYGDGTLDEVANQITAAGRALVNDPIVGKYNTDMTGFTCNHVRWKGTLNRGKPEAEENCAWVEVKHFEINAAPIAIN